MTSSTGRSGSHSRDSRRNSKTTSLNPPTVPSLESLVEQILATQSTLEDLVLSSTGLSPLPQTLPTPDPCPPLHDRYVYRFRSMLERECTTAFREALYELPTFDVNSLKSLDDWSDSIGGIELAIASSRVEPLHARLEIFLWLHDQSGASLSLPFWLHSNVNSKVDNSNGLRSFAIPSFKDYPHSLILSLQNVVADGWRLHHEDIQSLSTEYLERWQRIEIICGPLEDSFCSKIFFDGVQAEWSKFGTQKRIDIQGYDKSEYPTFHSWLTDQADQYWKEEAKRNAKRNARKRRAGK